MPLPLPGAKPRLFRESASSFFSAPPSPASLSPALSAVNDDLENETLLFLDGLLVCTESDQRIVERTSPMDENLDGGGQAASSLGSNPAPSEETGLLPITASGIELSRYDQPATGSPGTESTPPRHTLAFETQRPLPPSLPNSETSFGRSRRSPSPRLPSSGSQLSPPRFNSNGPRGLIPLHLERELVSLQIENLPPRTTRDDIFHYFPSTVVGVRLRRLKRDQAALQNATGSRDLGVCQ